tara:strand:+ start:889 stop:1200 length:312 start_codon:yes stop_codon:yes gene_type:complete
MDIELSGRGKHERSSVPAKGPIVVSVVHEPKFGWRRQGAAYKTISPQLTNGVLVEVPDFGKYDVGVLIKKWCVAGGSRSFSVNGERRSEMSHWSCYGVVDHVQ